MYIIDKYTALYKDVQEIACKGFELGVLSKEECDYIVTQTEAFKFKPFTESNIALVSLRQMQYVVPLLKKVQNAVKDIRERDLLGRYRGWCVYDPMTWLYEHEDGKSKGETAYLKNIPQWFGRENVVRPRSGLGSALIRLPSEITKWIENGKHFSFVGVLKNDHHKKHLTRVRHFELVESAKKSGFDACFYIEKNALPQSDTDTFTPLCGMRIYYGVW